MSDRATQIVQVGYDELAPRFGAWSAAIEGDPRDRFLAELTSRLSDGARVLDLGCGAGATAAALAERFEVTGIDISEAQLRLARSAAPRAAFLHGDFTEFDFGDASFDAATALYSITHVPREKHAALFAQVARWLVPGGLFLPSLGSRGSEDWTGEWLGIEMFFSSHDANTNRRLLGENGFRLLLDEVVTMQEPEGEATFLWVLARHD
jgi:ubiquinone/menaquinone biosynthesis C-methylase UbiE